MREPRIDEAKLASLRPVIVSHDGVTLNELEGTTLLLIERDPDASDPIDGDDLDALDITEVELHSERVIDLTHLVKWAIRQGY